MLPEFVPRLYQYSSVSNLNALLYYKKQLNTILFYQLNQK